MTHIHVNLKVHSQCFFALLHFTIKINKHDARDPIDFFEYWIKLQTQ